MKTKRRGSRQAEGSLPTGANLLPVLQVLSLVCLAISGLHILHGGNQLSNAAACYILGMTCLVGETSIILFSIWLSKHNKKVFR